MRHPPHAPRRLDLGVTMATRNAAIKMDLRCRYNLIYLCR
jgi:hypothetical protein